MTQEGGTPPGFWERIEQMIAKGVANYARSGPLRNASISDGGLTIKGGFLRLLSKSVGGVSIFYVGPVTPNDVDGEPQQGMVIRRSDGSAALAMYDAFPGVDGLKQALNWFDRAGNSVLADDTEAGQGLARPWLAGQFVPTRYDDFAVSTTSPTFETLWDTRISKQHPRLEVSYRASMDTAGATGETRVLVNGQPLGATTAQSFAVATTYAGPAAVAGSHMTDLVIEIQGRAIAGGALKVQPIYWRARQS